jgi:hypothetical protein
MQRQQQLNYVALQKELHRPPVTPVAQAVPDKAKADRLLFELKLLEHEASSLHLLQLERQRHFDQSMH